MERKHTQYIAIRNQTSDLGLKEEDLNLYLMEERRMEVIVIHDLLNVQIWSGRVPIESIQQIPLIKALRGEK